MKLRPLIFTLPLLFLAIFFLYPLATILRLSFAGDAMLAPAGAGLGRLFADSYYLEVIWFSAWQAVLSTALTLALALPASYVFARYRFPGQGLLRALASVPFVLPTVVVAAGFKALVGPRGLLNELLQRGLGLAEAPIRLDQTLALVLLAHVFYNYGVALRIIGGFWAALDVRLEQAAAVLGAGRLRTWREVTLPLLLPAIGAAALLIFIYTFASFGVIRILGGPRFATVEVAIFRLSADLLRLDLAAALALIQLVVTLLATLAYTRLLGRARAPLEARPSGRAPGRNPRRHTKTHEGGQKSTRTWWPFLCLRGSNRSSWRARLLVGVNVALLLLLIGAPLLALVLRSLGIPGDGGLTLEYYLRLGQNPTRSALFIAPLAAIGNTLRFALAATMLALLLGVPAAYLLAERTKNQEPRTKARYGRFSVLSSRFSALLDPLFMLPLGTSAITLGLGYIVALGRPPLNLLASPWLIPIAHTLLAFPLVLRALLPGLRALDPRLREAARTLGAGPLRVLREIDLPILLPALRTGAVFAFTISVGEFGAALLLARPEYQTLPVMIDRLLGLPGTDNYGRALALSTLLMLATTLGFLLIERVSDRSAEF